LGARVRGSQVIAPSDYFAGIWDTNTSSGELYGVPWYIDARLLFYRSDLLKQAGFSTPANRWDDWLQMLVRVKPTVGAERYASLRAVKEFEAVVAFSLQQNQSLLRDGDRWGNFGSADFRRTFHFYLSMFERGLAPAATNNDIANVWNEFGRGYFSFYITGPWNIGEFERRLPPELRDAWMTAPLPGPDGPGASIAGGSSLVMSSASRHKALAWQLIEHLSQPG